MDFLDMEDWRLSMLRLKLIKTEDGRRGSYVKVLDAPNYCLHRLLGRGGIQEHRKRSMVGEQIAYEFKYEHLHESAYRLLENWAHHMELDQKIMVKLTLKPNMDFFQPSEVYTEEEGEMEKDLRKQAERSFVQEEGGHIIRVKIAYENTTSAFRDWLKHHYNVEES
jgi:hypothetical protein